MMRLLYDHNLSPRLVNRLADLFPNSSHLTFHGMDQDDDKKVWEFARDNDYTLVTKDSDFHDLSLLNGFPPKVVWLCIGNCTTATIESLIRQHQENILDFETDTSAGTLALQ